MKLILDAEYCPIVSKTRSAKGDLGQLKPPAWLESESGLLIGSAEGGRYAAALLFDGESK